jgi:hypothetical protein
VRQHVPAPRRSAAAVYPASARRRLQRDCGVPLSSKRAPLHKMAQRLERVNDGRGASLAAGRGPPCATFIFGPATSAEKAY